MESKIQKDVIINAVIWGIQLVASLVIAVQIKFLAFLTIPYAIAVYGGLAALLALTWGLQFRAKNTRMWVARVLSLVLSVILMVGEVYLQKTFSAITDITEADMQTAKVGVYVLDENPAREVSDLADYDFGILKKMDRDNTDAALAMLEDDLDEEVLTYEYASLAELAAALMNKKVDAIVLNEAYIDLVEDMGETDPEAEEHSDTEGNEDTRDLLKDFGDRIREIASYSIPQSDLVKASGKKDRDDHTLVFYVSGIDTRGSKSTVSRSDVNILVVANTQTKQIVMINTPRDYFVPLSVSDGVRDKLTHAGLYGVDCSIDTLEMLYDVDIDYYFRVNFSGFEKIIDALGGIDVVSDYNFTHEGYSFRKGKNHLSGAAALHFARDRYSFAAGDVQRGKHQMKVIEAVFQKMTSPSMLAKYTDLMDSLDSAFDTNMDYDTLAGLVRMQLDDNAEWNIVMYNVDGTGKRSTTYSIPDLKSYVLVPDKATVETANDLMKQVRHGKILEPTE